jgi:NitT/TauT family transport system substrate-binding protein
MTAIRSRFAAWTLGVLATGFLLLPAHAEETKVRFLLDWAFQGQQAVFTIPFDDGGYKRVGLNVTLDRGSGSGDTVAKIASGAYDIGLADLYSMVRFNGENPDHQLIAVMFVHDKSALAVETKMTSGIKVPKDLEGKTMASPLGDASRQLFPLFADVNGIDQSTIKWSNVSPELREPMLVRGEAQAITGHITTVMPNLAGIGVSASDIRVMPYVDYGVGLYGHVIVVRPDYAAKNPEVIRNFARATVHGLSVMRKSPEVGMASVKKRDPLINEAIELGRVKMALEYMFITPNVLENGMSNVDIPRLEKSLQQVAKAFNLKTVPTAAQVYVDKYLPPRSELKLEP